MLKIINLKAYRQGASVERLVHAIERTDEKVIVCVQATDISEVVKNTKLKVFAQHVDNLKSGSHTGYVLPEAVRLRGASGTLLNHSEHKISFKELKSMKNICKWQRLKTVICVSSIKEAKEVMKLNPWAIAYEEEKLISTGKSITEYNSKEVKEFASLFKDSKIIPLCGAGISSKDDITKAEELGCRGVLIGSAVAKYGRIEILR